VKWGKEDAPPQVPPDPDPAAGAPPELEDASEWKSLKANIGQTPFLLPFPTVLLLLLSVEPAVISHAYSDRYSVCKKRNTKSVREIGRKKFSSTYETSLLLQSSSVKGFLFLQCHW
jgi:hypothetical protein